MNILILVLAWLTPAAIAAAFGWSGLWGGGNAFGDYLVPLPLAMGAFHVPSFAIAAGVILSSRISTGPSARYLPVLAFSVLAAALSLMLDFDRLNAWLFTDYEPSGSPIRLDDNPLLLFVASDAFWVGVYALMRGFSSPARSWLILPIIPVAAAGLGMVHYHWGGPTFEIGGSARTSSRGEKIIAVYTSASYDEAAFVDWIKQRSSSAFPWLNANSEHVAVVFTNSMQAIKWGRLDQIDGESIVATICLYEEDRSILPHPGYYDCFADRNTVEQEVAALVASESTGFGNDIDYWYARVLLCDGVEIPDTPATDIERIEVCRGVVRDFPWRISQFIEKYGEDSEPVSFVRTQAAARGLAKK